MVAGRSISVAGLKVRFGVSRVGAAPPWTLDAGIRHPVAVELTRRPFPISGFSLFVKRSDSLAYTFYLFAHTLVHSIRHRT
jgi:hypothetical protein